MKKNKTSKRLIALVAVLALAMGAVIGGTLAYLMDKTDPVVNTFTYGNINIKLTETEGIKTSTGMTYVSVMPGEKIEKDPTIRVEGGSKDCWLYVQIDKSEEFDAFMSYAIADGWTPLGGGYDNIWYRAVTSSPNAQDFGVLKDDQVTVRPEVTKEMVDSLNNKLPSITFTAYAVQRDAEQDALSSALNAWLQVPQEVATVEELMAALEEGKPATLQADMTVDQSILNNASVNINLNNKTLTLTNNGSPLVTGKVVFENGNIVSDNTNVFAGLKGGSELTLKNVVLDAKGSINVEAGSEPVSLNVIDSTITSTNYYCISTNAANTTTGDTVEINVVNSILTVDETLDDKNDCTAILFNVPGKLNISKSTLTGDRQAVIVRCGTASITGSKLICTGTFTGNAAAYDNANWGAGNEVPVAVLVVGNRSGAAVYPYDATCTLTDTILTMQDSDRAVIYAAAYNGHTTTINGIGSNKVTQSNGENSPIILN